LGLRVKKLLLASISAFIFGSGMADAADMSVKALPAIAPVAGWTGFYAGANAGYAWGRSSSNSSSDCPVSGAVRLGYWCDATFFPAGAGNSAVVGAQGSGPFSSQGFVGGGQAGYNWQRGPWVFGGEIDIQSFHLSGSRTGGAPYPVSGAGASFVETATATTNWLLTARARAGWTVSNALLYLIGGLAVTDLRTGFSFADNSAFAFLTNATGNASSVEAKVGYAVGAGTEWMLPKNWSIKAEYLYVSFGSVQVATLVSNPSFGGTGASNTVTTSANLNAHIARVGVNYHFGGPVVARY
jgi:outer membrane immunogenic protein